MVSCHRAVLLVALLVASAAGNDGEEYTRCIKAGACEMCLPVEKNQKYCALTQRRQEYSCTVDGDDSSADRNEESADSFPIKFSEGVAQTGVKHVIEYRSCTHTPQDDITQVIYFEMAMAVLGTLAMCGIKHQKSQAMSLYDTRLQKKHRGRGDGSRRYGR